MNAWIPTLVLAGVVSSAGAAEPNTLTPQERAEGWQLLFDGKSLDGWRINASVVAPKPGATNGSGTPNQAEEPPFQVKEGELLALGPRAHLFYVGPVANHDFRNFELKLDIKTYPNANSGVYFHTQPREEKWPSKGYEVQVNNSFDSDPSRTGGLWGVQDHKTVRARDGEWFTLYIKVDGKHILTRVNDEVIADYTQEPNPTHSEDLKGRLLDRGTIALQAHHKGNEVHYRSIKVRPLP